MTIRSTESEIIINKKKRLAVSIYHPKQNPRCAIMLAPATGILRKFYKPFAQYLTDNGFAVITYENYGIGESLNGKIQDNDASLVSWGTLDMPAVLDRLKEEYPQADYHLIGHSAGGQLAGLMPNCKEFKSMIFVACSSGSLKNIKLPFLLKAHFFMSVFIPVTNAILNYTPAHWMAMGEPLPRQVANQWSKWCRGTGYVKTAFGNEIQKHFYHNVNSDSLWLFASDDPIANEENVNEMIEVYKNIRSKKIKLIPEKFDCESIGHMKFFSRSNRNLWTIIIDHLKKNNY